MTKLSGARVEIPREEYDAFCYLRDVEHESVKLKLARVERLVEQQKMLEKQSKHMIDEQSLTLENLREKNIEQHALILRMQKRLAELEPVRCETPPPGSRR